METSSQLSNANILSALQGALHQFDQRIGRICVVVNAVSFSVTSVKKQIGEEIHFMFKNKLGFTKGQAQKLFYDYKNKRNQETPENEQKDQPSQSDDNGSVEQKISMIMNYMQETSTKLDQIEKDISYLKEQVDRILQKI